MISNTSAAVLWVCASSACVSDFSPDPHKTADEVRAGADTGVRDAAVRDARVDARSAAPDAERPADAELPTETDAAEPDPVEPERRCSLAGRWIMSERYVSSALGAKQLSVSWFYLELAQQGEELTFTKSLLCGGATKGLGIEITMDDSQAWPAYQKNTNYDGRTGSSKEGSSGCEVSFDEGTLVRAMTLSVYRDKSVALPALEQEASAGTPGWEDWDEDGKPGITMNVTGTAQGKIYTAFRTYTHDLGSFELAATSFTLEHDWVQERAVLSFDPPTAFILASPAERNPEQGGNIVELTRLADDQAMGDDDAKCEAMRALAPELTPNANKLE
jgi:hypothetical protein